MTCPNHRSRIEKSKRPSGVSRRSRRARAPFGGLGAFRRHSEAFGRYRSLGPRYQATRSPAPFADSPQFPHLLPTPIVL